MALTLCSNDNTLFPLTAAEEASLSQDWDFFSCHDGGRADDSDVRSVPFTAEQLALFLALAREWDVPEYHQDLETICSYFGPKSSKWLSDVALDREAPLDLLRRVGAAECALSYGDDILSAYTRDSLDRELVDKHAVIGALSGVGRCTVKLDLSNLQEFMTDHYSTAMRACKEVGDEYYEAYYAVTSGRSRSLPLATYEHVRTLLEYHYMEARARYGEHIKLSPPSYSDGLLAWTFLDLSTVQPGAMPCLEPSLYSCIVDRLKRLLGQDPQKDKYITEWLNDRL